jgi:hypothetical protein
LKEELATHRRAIKKQMEGFRVALKELEGREDIIYQHFVDGVLDKLGYQRQIANVRAERDDYNRQLEHLTLLIHDASCEAVEKMFELAIDAKSKWNLKSREERLEIARRTLSNATVADLSVQYHLQKPFETLAKMKGTSDWRREWDSNPRSPRGLASFQDWCIQPLYHLSVGQFIWSGLYCQRLGANRRKKKRQGLLLKRCQRAE